MFKEAECGSLRLLKTCGCSGFTGFTVLKTTAAESWRVKVKRLCWEGQHQQITVRCKWASLQLADLLCNNPSITLETVSMVRPFISGNQGRRMMGEREREMWRGCCCSLWQHFVLLLLPCSKALQHTLMLSVAFTGLFRTRVLIQDQSPLKQGWNNNLNNNYFTEKNWGKKNLLV